MKTVPVAHDIQYQSYNFLPI